MVTIAVAVAFIFALGFATRIMDGYWTVPDKYRIVYMLLGLAVGAIGYLITTSVFRLTAIWFDPGLFFAYMLIVDCLAAVVCMKGMRFGNWLQEKILKASPVI